MNPGGWSGLPRPRFGRRLLVAAVSWFALAGLALLVHPAAALVLGGLLLGHAARRAVRAREHARWSSITNQFQRGVTTAAVLMAAGFLTVTLGSVRTTVPPWLVGLLAGALAHYWLLGMTEAS